MSDAREALETLRRWLANERMSPEVLPYQAKSLDMINFSLDEQEVRLETLRSKAVADYPAILQLEMDRVKFTLRCYMRTRLYKIQKHAFSFVRQVQPLRQSRIGVSSGNSTPVVERSFASREDEATSAIGLQTPPMTRPDSHTNMSVSATDIADRSDTSLNRPVTPSGDARRSQPEDVASVGIPQVELTAEAVMLLSPAEQDFVRNYVVLLKSHLHNSFLNMLPLSYQSIGVRENKEDSVPVPDLNVHCFCRAINETYLDEGSFEGNPLRLEAGSTYVLRYSDVRRKIIETGDCELL
eukprot:ANDGO_02710.mRNA.1 DNA replication complex GINS protein sld5